MFKYNLYDGFLGRLIQTCHSRSSFEQVVQCELESHQIQGPIDMTTSFSTQQKPSFAPFILEGSTSSDVYNFLALYLPMDVDQKQQEQQDLEKAAKDQIKEEDEDRKNNKLMNHMFLDPCTSYSFYLFCSQSLITLMNKENKKSVCTSWLPEVPTTQLYNKNEDDEEVVLKRYSTDIKNRSAVLLETLNRQLALQALSKSIVNASRDYTDKTRHLARSLETLKQFLDEVVPNGTDALIQEMKKVPCIDGRDETTLLDLVNQELYDGNPQGEKQFLDAAEAPIRAKVAYLTTLNTVTQNVIASYLHDTERSVQLIVGSCISASTDIDHLQSIVQKSSAMNKNQTMELSIMVQQVNQMYEQYVRFYSNKTALLSDTILSLLSPYRKIASMQTAVQANMNYNALESSMNDLLGDYEFPSLYREAKQELLRQSEFYNEIDKHTVKFYNLLSNLISDEKLERSKFQDQLSNNIPSYGSNHRLYPFFAKLSLDEAIALPPFEHFSLPRHDGLPKVANPFEVVEDDEWEKVETEDVETRTSPRTTSGDSEDECHRNAQVPRGTSQSDHMLLEQIKKLEEDLDMKDSIISALGQQNEDLARREAKLQTVIEEKEKANVEIEEKCRSIVEGSKETNAELVNKYEQHITRLELMIDDLELRDKEQTHQIDVLNEDNKGLQEITTAMNKVVAKEKKSNQDLLDEIQHLKKQIQSSGIVSERTISLESEIFHLKKENAEMKRDAQLNLATIKELTEKIQSLNAQQSMMQHSIHSEFMKKEEEIIAKDTNLSRQNSDILRLLTSDKEQRSAIDLLRKELMTVNNQRDSLAQDLQFAQEHASITKRVQDALMAAGRFLNNQVDQAQQTIHTLQTKEEFVDKSLQANHLIDIMRILANSVLVVTQSLFNACKPLDLELFENNLEAVTEYIQEMLSNMETISEYLSNKISQNAPNDDLSSIKVSDIQNGDLVFIMRRSPTVYEVMNFDGKKMFLSPECVDSLEGEKRTDKFLRGYVFTTEIAEGDPLRITTEKDYTLVYLNAL